MYGLYGYLCHDSDWYFQNAVDVLFSLKKGILTNLFSKTVLNDLLSDEYWNFENTKLQEYSLGFSIFCMFTWSLVLQGNGNVKSVRVTPEI